MTSLVRFAFFFCISIVATTLAYGQAPQRNPTPTRAATPKNGDGHSSLAEVDQLVQAYLKDNNIPGVTVAISKNGRLVYSKAFGYANWDTKTAMQTTHRTLIGSVSKMLTAAAVMKLHETPGNGFTVDRKMYGPTGLFKTHEYVEIIGKKQEPFRTYYYNTQINHMLSHSAGWYGSGDAEGAAKMFNVAVDEVTPKHNHLYHISKKVPLTAPGTKFEYSNRSVGVMDHVIETVSGEKYKDYVKKHVLNPIGLIHVAAPSDPISSRDASPHDYVSGGPSFTSFKLEQKPGTGSAGGWRATASDMVRFMVATDQLGNQSDILKPETLNLMESRPFPPTVPNSALGWGVLVKGSGSWLTHGGGYRGSTAFIGKATPGYIAGDGTDISHVSVAICGNIDQGAGKVNLVVAIARLTGKATVPTTYDLFKPHVTRALKSK